MRASATLRPDPALAAPTLPLPMGGQITQVERRSVDAVVRLIEAAGLPYFLIPTSEPDNIRLGLPAERRNDLLAAVQRSGAGLAVSWSGPLRLRSAPARDAAEAGRRDPPVLWAHPVAHVQTLADARDALRAVQLEFWEPDGRGEHHAILPNPHADAVRFDAPAVRRRTRTGHDLPTFRAFLGTDMAEVTFPVDAVYLWVDDADPAWRARRDRTLRALGLDAGHESALDARFRQHDELRYSLRSLSQFAPWIRQVHLVTDRQVPAWLDEGCPRISIHDHEELFAGQGRLPTFNSHAISARLHHLPGLAEHFLYLNDDFFFGRRTGAQLWFDGNGQPRCYYTRTTADPDDLAGDSPLAQARIHTFELVEQLTGRVRRRNLQHGPYAMSREILLDLERALPDEFDHTWRSQVRGASDLVIERLHSQVGHGWGRVVDSQGLRYRYFNAGTPETRAQLRTLLRSRAADTFCVNDAEGPVPSTQRAMDIQEFLGAYYPTPSEFER